MTPPILSETEIDPKRALTALHNGSYSYTVVFTPKKGSVALGPVALANTDEVIGRLRRPNLGRIGMLNFKGVRFSIDVILVYIR